MNDKKTEKLLEEIKLLKHELSQQKKLFLNTIGKSLDGLIILDTNGTIIYANKSAVSLLNKNIGEIIGETLGIPLINEEMLEIIITDSNSNNQYIELNITSTFWENKDAYLVSLRNITEHKKAKNKLEALSNKDELTGLLNRRAFLSLLTDLINHSAMNDVKFAILYMDLNKFKTINDTYGHETGDKLLQECAKIFKRSIRATDYIARIGGDEFVILLKQINTISDVKKIIKNITENFKTPICIGENQFIQETSIGVSLYPDDSQNATELINYADNAMYLSKKKHQINGIFHSEINNLKP